MPIDLGDMDKKIDSGFAVLYSGGLDSTAVPLYLGQKFTGQIHLLTLHHNFGNFFVRWSEKHAEDLRRIYGQDRVLHSITNIHDVFKELTLKGLTRDVFQYGHFVWCLGCMLSILTKVIINNLIHQVPFAFVCSSVGGEYSIMSMPVSIDTKNELCNKYGIEYRAPLLEMNMAKPKERALLKTHDIWPGLKVLKGVQGVQPICIPGLMHIMDNLFDLHTEYDTDKVRKYILDREPIIRKVVESEFEKRGLDLEDHIHRLKALREKINAENE